MRKAEKKTALELVQKLYQAQEQIRGSIDKNDTAGALDFLVQCQQEAIQLGLLIERAEGEGFVTVNLLEEYCEHTYQLHEQIGTMGNEEVESYRIEKFDNEYNLLHRQLIEIDNSIKNGIRQRLEVVFLPYHASMWDSLESIWKAADNDDGCDAYVIPIPYYDKNPDGTFKEEHWEGDLYPGYVPITRYDEYDFAERRPDMIFIHNPYDHCNRATSVPPFFYSKNLKQFTDRLVYVPYFILEEISPNDRKAVEKIEHFCMLPGVINANKVIVQSESIRQIYINVLTDIAGKTTRGYWENKIAGLGSPKVDKVLNTKKSDLQIPREWLNIIQKPDGSWRKIVFYNTSIGALLQHSDKMLEKMKAVFAFFKEQREEVALLWRPHPLIKVTIESMRPQLWREYRELVAWYRKEGWGIYDDSADMDRAVVLSDAYYGDKSSVLQLFNMTKKPVMIQDVSVDLKDKRFRISLEDAEFEQEGIIFPAWDYDVICFYDFKTGITKKVSGYVSEDIFKQHVYGSVCKYADGKYLFAPLFGSKILLYDSEKNRFTYIKIDNVNDKNSDLFFSTIKYEKYVYLIPGTYKAIIQFDCVSETITYFNEWVDEMEQIAGVKKEFFRHGYGLIDDNLYLASRISNHILKFNLSLNRGTMIEVGNKDASYTAICSEGKNCWLAASDGKIVKWNSINQDCEIIAKPESVILGGDLAYSDLLYSKGKIYAIPYLASDGFEIDINTKKVHSLGLDESNENCICFFGKIYDNKLYTYSLKKRCLIEINLLQQEMKKCFYIYEDSTEPVSQEECYISNCMDELKNQCNEKDQNSLELFMKYITKNNIRDHVDERMLIGQNILEGVINAC